MVIVKYGRYWFIACLFLASSCNVIERTSRHGFSSGYYRLNKGPYRGASAYVEVDAERVVVYPREGDSVRRTFIIELPLSDREPPCPPPMTFHKQDWDIDITSALFKYRRSPFGLPAQVTTDFNAAIYAGWRHDYYIFRSRRDPVGRCRQEIRERGFDFGAFAGPGTAAVGSFSTRGAVADEYSGMILQYGLAGFIESGVASFGLSVGWDHLFGPDRKKWIYQNRPWIGFMVGIALN